MALKIPFPKRSQPLQPQFRRRSLALLSTLGGLSCLYLAPQLGLILYSSPRIYTELSRLPDRPWAIIFGAAVLDPYNLTDVTRERVEAGVQLYQQGKVQQLLMSGDNRRLEQADAMARYARRRGVPAAAIAIDRLGIDTHDTCRHARAYPGSILVSQGYHLPRSLWMCDREHPSQTQGPSPVQSPPFIGLAANRLGILGDRGGNGWTIARIRTGRFLREAGLTWLFGLGIYQRLSHEAEDLEATQR